MRDRLLNEALRRLAAEAATRFATLVASGDQIPFDVAESAGPDDAFFHSYVPLTGRYVRERAEELRSLPAFEPARDAVEAAGVAGSYLEQRTRALKTAIRVFQLHPDLHGAIGRELPVAYEAIGLLPQTGPEGIADRMLLYVGGHKTFPQDSGVGRVLRRLGYDEPPDSELPDGIDAWRRACTYLTHHAAATCTDKDPHCHVCPLRPDCPYGQDH